LRVILGSSSAGDFRGFRGHADYADSWIGWLDGDLRLFFVLVIGASKIIFTMALAVLGKLSSQTFAIAMRQRVVEIRDSRKLTATSRRTTRLRRWY